MPATVTHAYFAKDVLDILPEDIQKRISCSRIKTFGQSMDALMFYHMFSFHPGKKIRQFARYFHRNQSQEYFIHLINYIKTNHLETDSDVCSYLAGMICHYVLDSTIHPYVYYKTGCFNRKDPSTYKYNNVHTFMETFIDNDMISRREKNSPYSFPIGKFCFDTRPFSSSLNVIIDASFDRTFHLKNMSKTYYQALTDMKHALVLFRRDPLGWKKFCYQLIDTFTPRNVFRFEAVSYHYPLKDRHNFLNTNHSLWRNPTTYDMTSTESFVDLYLKAIKLAKVLICASFDYISGKDIELDKIFLNKSYVTGLDCNMDKELKYFEF